jgi:hypothetical protein
MSQPPQGVKISAYIFFAMAALTMLLTCFILVAFGLALADPSAFEDAGPEQMVGLVVSLCLVVLFTVLYAAVGYGLLKLQSWARIAAIVLAILSLCSFPLGTILGGIVLYLMFQQENVQAFS